MTSHERYDWEQAVLHEGDAAQQRVWDAEALRDAELLADLVAKRELQAAARGHKIRRMKLTGWECLLWVAVGIVIAGVVAVMVVTAVRSY